MALWILGQPDRAQQMALEAIALGRETGHPYSLGAALAYGCWLQKMRGDVEQARALSAEAVALASEQDFPLWLWMGQLIAAWVRGEEGAPVEASADVDSALADLGDTGHAVGTAAVMGEVAELYELAGRTDEARSMVEVSIGIAQAQKERLWEAELYRVQADLLLAADPEAQSRAEALLHQALDTARRQGARSFALRAAMGLARLWRNGPRQAEGRQTLAGIYAEFNEGFDTRDLTNARELLEQLD